jgi:hypothetical protein
MRPTYVLQTRLEPGSIALFVDAGHVRRCAARSHEIVHGSRIGASRIDIDAGQISRFLDSLIVDFDLDVFGSRDGDRPRRRLYDSVAAERRQRWRQPHYRSVVRAEGFVVRAVRAPRRLSKPARSADNRDYSRVEAALGGDLVCLAAGEVATAVLLAGDEGCASAVRTARELGADVVLLIPGGCRALVAELLRDAATRVIGLHPEVFEALFEVREASWRRPDTRGSARSAAVAGVR